MTEFRCFAHRGASGHAPENTLMAVQQALALGAHWVEVDVYLSHGELVVIHDRRLERTTSGTGDVTRRELSYIRSLDAGRGEKIPLLREVMAAVAGRAGINVELKGAGTAPAVVALIQEFVVRKKIGYDRVLVSSFDHYQLLEVKKRDPRIPVGALMAGIPLGYARFAERIDAVSVHLHREYVNREFVADAHRRGLHVFVYTVNLAEEIQRLRQLGVDGVFTDFPELCGG